MTRTDFIMPELRPVLPAEMRPRCARDGDLRRELRPSSAEDGDLALELGDAGERSALLGLGLWG